MDELKLDKEGMIVLGVVRHAHEYIGTPDADQCVLDGDKIVVYGRANRIEELRKRSKNDESAHPDAEQEQRAVRQKQPD